MRNKELLLVHKHGYTLTYRIEYDGRYYGYRSGVLGQVLYDDVEANTSTDKQWKAFKSFRYDELRYRTFIELEYTGTTAPDSPEVFINGILYPSSNGSIYLDGDPFSLESLYVAGSPLYLNIKYP